MAICRVQCKPVPVAATLMMVWIGIVLFGCGTRGFDDQDAILHVGNGAEPQDLDPHLVTGVPESRILSALFEGLTDVDPRTLEPIPGAAESWSVSDDGTVYTFTLRPDGRWSNGDPVTAHDFAYAWRRILTPALGAEYAYMLFCIKNARPFHEGDLEDFDEVGVRVIDDHTLEVTLENPTPYFLSMQIHYTWFPVHQPTIEAFGEMDHRGTRWTRAGNHVGNGPFKLDRWEPDRVIAVSHNPAYWNAAATGLEGVWFYPIDNALTEELLFRQGRLHLTENVPVDKIEVYQRDTPEVIRIDPYLGTYYFRLNVTRPPLDNPKVRRALGLALDRDDLVRNVVRAGREPAFFYTPPDTAGYTSEARMPYDPDKARELLAEAGYPDGQGLPPIELLYNTSENHRMVAEAVQAMWDETLNVRVTLTNQEWKVYLNSMQQLDYGIARSGWIGDFVDPINFLECFTTGNGNNRTGFSSPEFDALIEEARRTVDPEARLEFLQEAEHILMEEAPIIPVYFYTRTYLQSPEIEGLAANPLGYIAFHKLGLRDRPRTLAARE